MVTSTLLLLALFSVAPGSGYHTGAPESTCGDLHPLHGADPQTSSSPFTITFTPATFTPGSSSPVTVTLTTLTGNTFEGFLLTTQYEGQGVDSAVRPGTFTTIPLVTKQLCSNSAVTHSNRNSLNSLSFQWTPPAASGGNIRFRATFVREKTVYWEDVKAADLLLESAATTDNPGSDSTTPTQSPQTAPPTSAQPPSNETTQSSSPPPSSSPANTKAPPADAEKVGRDADCGDNKGCYSVCQDGACSFVVTWSAGSSADSVRMTMRGRVEDSSSYIALGLSQDGKMGSDSVMHCVNQPSGVFFSYNVDGDTNNVLLDQPQEGLSDIDVTYADNVLTCRFSRVKVADTSGQRFALDTPYTLLYATGPASGREAGYHGTVKPVVSTQTASLVDFSVDIGGSAPDNLFVKVHGSLMLVAWVFAASIGIVLARYFKDVWQQSAWCGQKIWFQLHRGCMVLALLATVAAFIVIFVEVGGYSDIHGKTYLKAHPILGIIVTALTVLNPVMAMFRPHPNTPRRPIFNWAHWTVGSGAHILAVITIFFGLLLKRSGAGDSMLYVLAAYVGWQVLVQVLLEIVQCMARRREDPDSYEMTSINNPEASKITARKESDFSKRLLLSVHLLVVTGLSVALLVMLNTGSDNN